MTDGLGNHLACTPAYGSVLSRGVPPNLPFSACVIARPGPQSSERCHLILGGPGRPPEAAWGEFAHLARLPTSQEQNPFSCHPSQGYVLGWGHRFREGPWGGRPKHTRTHAPAARLSAEQNSADSLVPAQTQSVSLWRVRQCLQLKASPLNEEEESFSSTQGGATVQTGQTTVVSNICFQTSPKACPGPKPRKL